MADPEHERLAGADRPDSPWRLWGPYLAERAWGTVREDYSADGDAWASFPFEHAQSRAYRWNEDGLGGICDESQFLCFALALWNGRDERLKERVFGLTGPQGNHGEDAKEYWWYLDATPTASWLRWRYHYPRRSYPYDELVAEAARRTRFDPEQELLDTGAFDDGFWQVTAEYAKASPTDICIELTVTNCSNVDDELHVLPTMWFRNTWAWGHDPRRSTITASSAGRSSTTLNDASQPSAVARHGFLGEYILTGEPGATVLCCDNESNVPLLWNAPGSTAYPKDGINDHVVHGAPTVNPNGTGSKSALWYRIALAAGATRTIRLRLRRTDAPADQPVAAPAGPPTGPPTGEATVQPATVDLTAGFDQVHAARLAEADAFYAAVTPVAASADEALVLRQAFAGMIWSKQFFHLDVSHWLTGDPGQPPPPAERLTGRNHDWRHLNNRDVVSMPDTWEYPWYASWDLAFHCVTLAHVDPMFAKSQLTLLCREWYMHPNGQLPAYEWSFGDVNPPVHAWAALRVFEIDGGTDFEFLERIFHKLLINFTWWVNRKDTEGNNLFEGGFLGLDNIGPIDRSAPLRGGGHIEQSDGTAWMATYCLNMLETAMVLAVHDRSYEDMCTKFFEHFASIAVAINSQGLWDETDGFYYDVIHTADGRSVPLKVRSMVGLIPLFAVAVIHEETRRQLPDFAATMDWFLHNKADQAEAVSRVTHSADGDALLLSVVPPDRIPRVLATMLDEREFLSPHGLRSLSRRHLAQPYELNLDGVTSMVNYEPAESQSALYGGNSNWRGPVWFPLNHLIIEALERYEHHIGNEMTIAVPTGSVNTMSLGALADELRDRLIGLFLPGADGRRPCFGGTDVLQHDARWRDQLLFNEYFNGDDGAGLGASHQTGWTGLVADMIIRRHRV